MKNRTSSKCILPLHPCLSIRRLSVYVQRNGLCVLLDEALKHLCEFRGAAAQMPATAAAIIQGKWPSSTSQTVCVTSTSQPQHELLSEVSLIWSYGSLSCPVTSSFKSNFLISTTTSNFKHNILLGLFCVIIQKPFTANLRNLWNSALYLVIFHNFTSHSKC